MPMPIHITNLPITLWFWSFTIIPSSIIFILLCWFTVRRGINWLARTGTQPFSKHVFFKVLFSRQRFGNRRGWEMGWAVSYGQRGEMGWVLGGIGNGGQMEFLADGHFPNIDWWMSGWVECNTEERVWPFCHLQRGISPLLTIGISHAHTCPYFTKILFHIYIL
jgi:hypothetical protein